MKSKNEIFEGLTGPIPTVRTPYSKDGEIDYSSLKDQIEFLVSAGAKSIVLTAGDSHLQAMSDREIAELTKVTAEQVAGRALMVAADCFYDTKSSLKFADFCKESKVDVLMTLPPDWANSNTEESLANHYATVAERIPVMIVTNIFIKRGIDFGLKTIELSLEKSKNIVSVKDDMCGVFARKLMLKFGDQVAVWAGGQKQNHMNMAPYGCQGYLSTFMCFKPDIAWDYWKAFTTGNYPEAVRIIEDYDIPFIEFIAKLPGGFDAGIHGVLEIFGLAKRYRPLPYPSLGDEETEALKSFMRIKKLI